MLLHQTKKQYQIPPTRFELVSPDPKSCMIDRYTTGVDIVLVEHTLQISLLKICSVYFSVEDIKNNISRHISEKPRNQSREEGRYRPEIMRKVRYARCSA